MKNLFLLFTILLGLNSCNSWLDVQPYDRVAEDVVFESVKGFENALNGIYIELNTNSLYCHGTAQHEPTTIGLHICSVYIFCKIQMHCHEPYPFLLAAPDRPAVKSRLDANPR